MRQVINDKYVIINNQTVIDLKDMKIVQKPHHYIKYDFNRKLWCMGAWYSKKNYYRLISTQRFISKGNVIEPDSKGAYIEGRKLGKFSKPKFHIKLGQNSWIDGSFVGTDKANSFVDYNVKIGDNSYVGMNTSLGKGVLIGNNTIVGGASKIGRKTMIGDDCKIHIAQISDNTSIGDKSSVGDKSLNGVTAIGGASYIGISPQYWDRYWWNKNINPYNFSFEGFTSKELPKLVKRYLVEKMHDAKKTMIGQNVNIDCDCKIMSGAVIGDNAKLGYQVSVRPRCQVENGNIINNKQIVTEKYEK